jgi:coiled-coil domain-containing protein 61
MLVTALSKSSDSVCVDLLTYSDLEVLKAKRLRRAGQDVPSRPNHAALNNKRYLILTYQGEFDKVHYPLPLAYEEHPDPADLKKTICNLRGESPCCSLLSECWREYPSRPYFVWITTA